MSILISIETVGTDTIVCANGFKQVFECAKNAIAYINERLGLYCDERITELPDNVKKIEAFNSFFKVTYESKRVKYYGSLTKM